MYKVGDEVQLKKGRSLEGSYKVTKIHPNGTYDLKDAAGNVKLNVKEDQLD